MGRRLSRPRHPRLLAVGLVLLGGWALIGFRLFQVQGVKADELNDEALGQRLRRVVLAADRGSIFDRDMRELAISVDATSVYANTYEIGDRLDTAEALAAVLGRPASDIAAELDRDSSFVYLARKLPNALADQVRQLGLTGIHLLRETKRVYPAGELAAQVLGFVGSENLGLEGIESYYDEALAGRPGELVFERSGTGQVIPQGDYLEVPAVPGSDIVLTIDGEIQFFAEQAVAAAAARSGAERVQAVVLDVETFEILAIAGFPTFNPNQAPTADPSLFRNRALTDTYEPGSTQKLITVSAAIEEDVVGPGTSFDVSDEIVVADRTYKDYREHPDATWDVDEIVGKSSNVGVIRIWEELGDQLLYRYLESFGIGQRTGVDFPGEAKGVLRPLEDWCESCGASTAIGYRVSVTPLQMTAVYATVGNDGLWVQPRLVKSIVDAGGARHPFVPEEARVISTDTARTMRSMLAKVVREGTGTNAAVAGYTVGGKTGTTRKFVQDIGRYGNDVVATFIGIGPHQNARLAVGVFVDAPKHARLNTGGTVAAPVFAEIMEFALHQMGVPPDAGCGAAPRRPVRGGGGRRGRVGGGLRCRP